MTPVPTVFSVTFDATELDARRAIGQIVERLETSGLGDDQVGTVQIVLAESVNNVVEHSYAGQNAGQIEVECDVAQDALSIQICDTGTSLIDQGLPAGKPADVSGTRDTLPEGGFGWFLIRALTRDIAYHRENGCNHLVLSFHLA